MKKQDKNRPSPAMEEGRTGKLIVDVIRPPPPADIPTVTMNPLEIDHILDHVLGYVIGSSLDCPRVVVGLNARKTQSETVKNLRLVSKKFAESATKYYRQIRGRMVLANYHRFNGLNQEEAKIFLDIMENSSCIPVQHYYFNEDFFRKENEQLLKDFMRICGPTAVRIDIYFEPNLRIYFNRRFFRALNLEKLKVLSLRLNGHYADTVGVRHIHHFLRELLKGAGNLQEFKLCSYKMRPIWPETTINQVKQTTIDYLPKSVKVLKIESFTFDLQQLHQLAKNHVKLRELELDSTILPPGNEQLCDFLQEHSTTLKALCITPSAEHRYSSTQVPYPLKMPSSKEWCFTELLHLDLMEVVTIPFPFNWTQLFPKLQRLSLVKWKTEDSCMKLLSFKRGAKPHLHLREVYFSFEFPHAPMIMQALKIFPNITKLHLTISPDLPTALKCVFEHFPNAQELYVSSRGNYGRDLYSVYLHLDSLLSGVSIEDYTRLVTDQTFDYEKVFVVHDAVHSLRNLKYLRKLVIDTPYNRVDLTDFCVRFVFLHMAKLAILESQTFQISLQCQELLKTAIDFKILYTGC